MIGPSLWKASWASSQRTTIHQWLPDEPGVQVSVTSLKQYVALLLSEDATRSKVAVLREDSEPGAEAQIDYGLLGSWPNPTSGRAHGSGLS